MKNHLLCYTEWLECYLAATAGRAGSFPVAQAASVMIIVKPEMMYPVM